MTTIVLEKSSFCPLRVEWYDESPNPFRRYSPIHHFYLTWKNIRVSVMTRPWHTGGITTVKLSMGSNVS